MKIISAKFFLLCAVLYSAAAGAFSQDRTIYLWRGIPGMERENSVMYVHSPEKNESGTAVIICPGGSYHHLGLYNEGYKSSKWFSSIGITAFMLKYRTNESGYNHPAMLQDIQRAIQIVRENAGEYGVNPDKIGVIGYSAGGHLVTMAAEFAGKYNGPAEAGITSGVSLRPDFVIPVYPVVSMQDEIAHRWSRKSLLGKNPTQQMKDDFSMEKNVPDDMPPTYIVVAKDDDVVDYRNSLVLYDALKEKQIPGCRLAVYEWGKHGFGMLDNDFMKEFKWNESLKDWLEEIGALDGSEKIQAEQ